MNPLIYIDACLWSSLHFVILNIPPSRLPLFPLLAGLVWLATLASLLLSWVAHGMPRYPGQNYPIAFISDIASFELKPLFLIGSSITGVCFVVTVAAVHVMRYEPGFALLKDQSHDHGYQRVCGQQQPQQCAGSNDNNDEHENTTTATTGTNNNNNNNNTNEDDDDDDEDFNTTKTLRVISLLSVFAAITASTALVLLSILDTFRHRALHQFFLQICFSGLALQAAGTAVVYANEVVGFVSFLWNRGRWLHDWGGRSVTVRTFVSLSTALILVEIFLCITFVSITTTQQVHTYRRAAILEWAIAFLGAVYLWLFGGFFLDRTDSHLPKPFPRGEMHGPDPERRPLLGSGSASASGSDHENTRASYTEV